MTEPLIPVGTVCRDAKHGARCRVRGYRTTQKAPQEGSTMAQGQASGAIGGMVCEVELLEAATLTVWTGEPRQQGMQPKGAIVLTRLDKLTVDK